MNRTWHPFSCLEPFKQQNLAITKAYVTIDRIVKFLVSNTGNIYLFKRLYSMFIYRQTLQAIIRGTVDGNRRIGRPWKSRTDNIKEWTDQSTSSLLRITNVRG